jgi:dTDP-4-dehydrorhamnose reductase
MSKVLITGATGFVGSQIADVLVSRDHDVVAATRSEPKVDLPWAHTIVDYTDRASLAEKVSGFDAIVHCAIANDFDHMMTDRNYGYDSYVGVTQQLSKAAVGIPIHYISTDWVTDGQGHLVPETLPPNPINLYGVLKALSEQVIRDRDDPYTIMRIGGVMGQHRLQEDGPRSQDCGFGFFVTSLVKTVQAGRVFQAWIGQGANLIATPSLAAEIGATVDHAINRQATGIFHLVASEAITREDLVHQSIDVFELDPHLVEFISVPDSQRFPGAVPIDTSLASEVTKATLGMKDFSVREALESLRVQLETGRLAPITDR